VKRYDWRRLNHLQLGKYAEYFVKMELTLYGLDTFTPEVDDKGIDFIVRNMSGEHFEVQVKSVRRMNYIFFPKSKFEIRSNMFAAVVVFETGKAPKLFLIPSEAWNTPNALLRSHDFEGKKGKPEWGLNISRKNWPLLERFAFEKVVQLIARNQE